MVAAGLAVALVPASTRVLRAADVRYLAMADGGPHIISLAAWRSRDETPVLCRLLDTLRTWPTGRVPRFVRGGRPVSHDADLYADLYKERNTAERLINKLKAWRGIATRYDKTPGSYLAGLHLRTSMIQIDDLDQGAHAHHP
ncbi:hypothetical protein FraQA3DRAFT_2251 [Frankia sp. QA3]|nr:hypothetical protein FraQA3DRAFT_2251 [Frankia sp. QA3]